MLMDSELVAFSATTNTDASRQFYAQQLGLTLIEESPFALVFKSKNARIRIQKIDQSAPAPHTSLGWDVANISVTVRHLQERGVSFEQYAGLEQDELSIWSAPGGARVAWFKDPDGNILSISQHE